MSSLIGQNIGGNPRGILNLGATINTPLDTTLRNVTDGLGNNSPLQLSTTQVSVVAARNYNTLFVGGSAASGIRVSNSSDAAANGWNLSVNGSAAAYFSIAFGTSAIYSTSAISFNSSDLTTLVNKNLYVGYNDAAFPNASARLHVRGDGTNPIARFENNAGTRGFIFTSIGDLLPIDVGTQFGAITAGFSDGFALGGGIGGWKKDSGSNHLFYSAYQNGFRYTTVNNTSTSGTGYVASFEQTFGAGAGSANFRPLNLAYTINNSGAQTGTATGIFLNATETALNGMGHNLMDLQVGGASAFRVSRNGQITIGSLITFVNGTFISTSFNGIIRISNDSGVDFNRLQLGGTTNAFPAIKRNGAAIDFRLADDSAFCTINTLDINTRIVSGNTSSGLILRPDGGGISGRTSSLESFTSGLGWTQSFLTENGKDYGIMSRGAIVGASTLVASAVLQVDSTTRGFLPPRQSTTQRNAITSPAKGLIVFDSDINKLFVFSGATWEEITSV